MTKQAILIASDTYEDVRLPNLEGPSNDIATLGNLLRDPTIGGYLVTAFNNATSFEVLPAIDKVLSEAAPGELILLYYSGHGKLSFRGQLCLAMSNTSVDTLQTTSLPMTLLKSLIDQSRSGSIVLILDCCFSGAAGKAFTRSTVEDQLQLIESAGVHIISSSTATELSREEFDSESQATFGLFSKALISGISSGQADVDRDGFISLADLIKYFKNKLRGQRPKYWGFGANTDLSIAVIPRHKKPRSLPEEIENALQSPYPEIRAGAVNALAKLATAKQHELRNAAKAALERLADDDSRAVASQARRALGTVADSLEKPHRKKNVSSGPLKIALDTWIGWRNCILTCKRRSSRYELSILDDRSDALEQLMEGRIHLLGTTLNRFPLEVAQARKRGVDLKTIFLNNRSAGADSVLQAQDLSEERSLNGDSLVIPEKSEAVILALWWLINKLQKDDFDLFLRKKLILTSGPEEAVHEFLSGSAQRIAIWEPFVTKLRALTGASELISTSAFGNLIFDSIIAKSETIVSRANEIQSFISEVIEQGTADGEMMKQVGPGLGELKTSMQSLAYLSEDELSMMMRFSPILNHKENLSLLTRQDGIVDHVLRQSAYIWELLGMPIARVSAPQAVDARFVLETENINLAAGSGTPAVSPGQRRKATLNPEAFSKTLEIRFPTKQSTLLQPERRELHKIATLANIANHCLLEIDLLETLSPQATRLTEELCWARVRNIALYIESEGVEPSRITIITRNQLKSRPQFSEEIARIQFFFRPLNTTH